MRSLIIRTRGKYYSSDQIKAVEMGGACYTLRRMNTRLLVQKPDGQGPNGTPKGRCEHNSKVYLK